jgi:N-acetylneuraminate synthase
LEKVAATRRPVVLSSGLSTWQELNAATDLLRNAECPFAVLQCTSSYPCPPQSWGLNLLREIGERYHCPVGLSDHSGTLAPSLAAVTLGASIVEFHITLSPHMFGPDASSSLTVEKTAELVRSVRQLEQALASPVDKDAAAAEKAELRSLFTKSVVAADDLPAGVVVERRHLAFKKPGDGIPANQYRQLLGRRTNVALKRDDPFKFDQLDAPPG